MHDRLDAPTPNRAADRRLSGSWPGRPHFAARAAAHDADDTFVADNYRRARADGRLLGRGPRRARRRRRIARRDVRRAAHARAVLPSTALALSMHTHQVAAPAWRWRHERAPVEPSAARRRRGAVLVTQRAGPTGWPARAAPSKVDGGYRVTGRKVFASGSPAGDLLMTMAIYDDPADGPHRAAFRHPVERPA